MRGINPFSKPPSKVIKKLNEKKQSWALKVSQLQDSTAIDIKKKLELKEKKKAGIEAKREERLALREKKKAETAVNKEAERLRNIAIKIAEKEQKQATRESDKEEKRLEKQELREIKKAETAAYIENKKWDKQKLREKKEAEKEAKKAEWRKIKEFENGINIDQYWNYSLVNTVKENFFIIPLENILAFHAEDKYITVRHKWDTWETKTSFIDYTLKKAEESILNASCEFIRVHRNALININWISSIWEEIVSWKNIDDFRETVINFQLTNKMSFDDVIGNTIDTVSLDDGSTFAVSRRKLTQLKRIKKTL